MINFQVRRESGEIVRRGAHGVDGPTILDCFDSGEFPFLGSLLPYADTMFNKRQVRRLREELLEPVVAEILGRDVTDEIEDFCRQVEGGVHLYLWFLGD